MVYVLFDHSVFYEISPTSRGTPTPHGRPPVCPLRKRDRCIGISIGYASGMHRVCIGYESGMHRGAHQVITLSAKLSEGGFGRAPTS